MWAIEPAVRSRCGALLVVMPEDGAVQVREADLSSEEDGHALADLIDSYARESGGQSAPLSAEALANLVPGLRNHTSAFVLLAVSAGQRVGAAVCVWGFSTFAGRPSLNIHDLVVHTDHRSRGIGTKLLAEAERRARERGACKLTLEVLDTNSQAKQLYERLGFGPWTAPTLFVTKPIP